MALSRDLFKGDLLREPPRLEEARDLEAAGESVRARRVAGRPILRNPSTSKQSSAHA